MDQAIHYFASLGISHPDFQAHLVVWVEIVGGILLVLGLASRLACIPLIIAMISALSITNSLAPFGSLQNIFNPAALVREEPFPFLVAVIIIFIFGPGRVSLDGWIKRRSQHWKSY